MIYKNVRSGNPNEGLVLDDQDLFRWVFHGVQNEGSVRTFLTRSLLQPVFPGRSGYVHTEGDADLLSFPYANET